MRDRENGSPTGKGLEGSQRTGCHDGAVGWPGESVCSRGEEEARRTPKRREWDWAEERLPGGKRAGCEEGVYMVKF